MTEPNVWVFLRPTGGQRVQLHDGDGQAIANAMWHANGVTISEIIGGAHATGATFSEALAALGMAVHPKSRVRPAARPI